MVFLAIKYNTKKLFLSSILNIYDFYIYYKKLYYIEEKYFIKYFYFKKSSTKNAIIKREKLNPTRKKISKKLKINLPFNSILIVKFADITNILIYSFELLIINI